MKGFVFLLTISIILCNNSCNRKSEQSAFDKKIEKITAEGGIVEDYISVCNVIPVIGAVIHALPAKRCRVFCCKVILLLFLIFYPTAE